MPLAAIAGPTGITVIDASSPQLRPWLVLDYGSFTNGGITTMAFQPCPSSVEQQHFSSDSLAEDMTEASSSISNNNSSDRYSYNEASILLATARGSGILIWDCSGRVLSPLLGRLNASNDPWGSDNGIGTADTTAPANTVRNKVDDAAPKMSGHSVGGGWEETGIMKKHQLQARAPAVMEASNTAATQDAVPSATMYSDTNMRAATATLSHPASYPSSKGGNNVVTSMDWKGPSAPILLSTFGEYALVWDLRTALFSGKGMGGNSGGARPTARFRHSRSSNLIHCAYCHDESKHIFATLDSVGRVSVWDDRNADSPKHSFLACPGGGVGIASISPPRNVVGGAESRWVTWGMDDSAIQGGTSHEDLVVKVWSKSEPISTAALTPYHMTSRISTAGAVVARVHPSFAGEILLFREIFATKGQSMLMASVPGILTPPRFEMSSARGGNSLHATDEGLVENLSTNTRTAIGLKMVLASPEMSVMQRPPSPPNLMLEETEITGVEREYNESSWSRANKGWEVELWRIDTNDSSSPITDDGIEPAANEQRINDSINAQKIVAFRGGGADEDVLSFAPGRGDDASDVIAADLIVGTSAESDNDELSVCVLTKTGRLTIYGVSEAPLLPQEKTSDFISKVHGSSGIESHMTKSALSVCKGATSLGANSEWWNNNEEEDLFGETNNARDKPIIVDSSLQIDVTLSSLLRGALPQPPEDKCKNTTASSIIKDDDLDPFMEAVVDMRGADTVAAAEARNFPIDPNVASRVPSPPLCGVTFSGVGGLVSFNNGPVKKMWAFYHSNRLTSPTNKSHTLKIGTDNIFKCKSIHSQNSSDHRTCGGDSQSAFPRTLMDLIDMNLQSQTLQWGDGDNEQSDDDAAGGGGGNSTSTVDSSCYEDGDMLTLESDESSRSPESEGSECSADNLFEDYFSSSRKSLMGTKQEVANEAFGRLLSLSPFVSITKKHDDILLSEQTPQLATSLILGNQWCLRKDFTIQDSTWQHGVNNGIQGFPRECSESNLLTTSLSDRIHSRAPALSTHKTSKHGTMMGNLKKLFSNQLPTAMTPPDQRLCKFCFN